MALQSPKVIFLELPHCFRILPQGVTLEALYQINNQSIWFIAWILKKKKFGSDMIREALETPFRVEREYWLNGKLEFIKIKKDNITHGIARGWSWTNNEQLWWESNWKNGRQHGIQYWWNDDGQLTLEQNLS